MDDGKKSVAEAIVYGALDRLGEKSGADPLDKVRQALTNIGPLVEVKSRRVGGANYQVPTEVRPSRQQALAMRWLIDAARKLVDKAKGILMKQRRVTEEQAYDLLRKAGTNGVQLPIKRVEGDKMITNRRRPILTLIADTSPGRHDTLIAPCDAEEMKRVMPATLDRFTPAFDATRCSAPTKPRSCND